MEEKIPLLSSDDSTAANGSQTISIPSKRRLRQYVIAIVILLGCFINNVCIFLPTAFYPQVAAERKGSKADTEVGIMIGSIQVSGGFVSIFAGAYMNKMGVRFLITSGAFLLGGSTVIFAFLGSVKAWAPFIGLSVVIRFVMGFGDAAFTATSLALLLNMFPSHTAKAWAINEFAISLGFVSGAPIGGFLYDAEGFYFPFVVTGAILLVFTPLLFLLLADSHRATESTDDDDERLEPVSMWKLLKMPSVLIVCLNVFSTATSLALLETSMSVYLDKEFGWTSSHIGLVFLITGATYAISCAVFSPIIDATSPRVIMITGLLVGGCGMMLVGPSFVFSFLSRESWCLYTGTALVGLGMAMVMISAAPDVIHTAVSRGYKQNMTMNGAVSGLLLAVMYLSGAAGAPIAGLLTAAFNFRISSSLFAFLDFLLVIITVLATVAEYYV